MCGRLGTTEILLILGVIAILFGARKLPEIGEGMGRGLTNFKRGLEGKPLRKRKVKP